MNCLKSRLNAEAAIERIETARSSPSPRPCACLNAEAAIERIETASQRVEWSARPTRLNAEAAIERIETVTAVAAKTPAPSV